MVHNTSHNVGTLCAFKELDMYLERNGKTGNRIGMGEKAFLHFTSKEIWRSFFPVFCHDKRLKKRLERRKRVERTWTGAKGRPWPFKIIVSCEIFFDKPSGTVSHLVFSRCFPVSPRFALVCLPFFTPCLCNFLDLERIKSRFLRLCRVSQSLRHCFQLLRSLQYCIPLLLKSLNAP